MPPASLKSHLIMIGGLLALVLVLALWLSGALSSGGRAATEARLGANRADAALATASDAAQSVATQAAAEANHDALTRENDHEIHSAPGADAPVDPRLHDAGLRSLCRRAAYRGSQQCLQFAAPR